MIISIEEYHSDLNRLKKDCKMKYFINDQTDFSAHKQIVLDNLERIDFRDLTCVIDASLMRH